MTYDEHRSRVNKNHGACLAILVQLDGLNIPAHIKTEAKEALNDHDMIVSDLIAEFKHDNEETPLEKELARKEYFEER